MLPFNEILKIDFSAIWWLQKHFCFPYLYEVPLIVTIDGATFSWLVTRIEGLGFGTNTAKTHSHLEVPRRLANSHFFFLFRHSWGWVYCCDFTSFFFFLKYVAVCGAPPCSRLGEQKKNFTPTWMLGVPQGKVGVI